jgi:hypothetical protein
MSLGGDGRTCREGGRYPAGAAGRFLAWESYPVTSQIERMRAAIKLVMQDVLHELGELRLTVAVGTAEQISEQVSERFGESFDKWFLKPSGTTQEILGWVLDSDGHGQAFSGFDGLGWGSFVAGVADTLQDEIIESADHWGTAFPICRAHGVHPMDSAVLDDVAFWVCPKGSGTPIPIGTLSMA